MNLSSRHIEGKNSWLKHIDFMFLDIAALIIAFIAAYVIKFHSFDFWGNGYWRSNMVVICLLDLVVILFSNPFSGIIRRFGAEELLKISMQALYNMLLCGTLFYVLKIGEIFSRTVILMTYLLYCPVSYCFRTAWKGLCREGKVPSLVMPEESIFVIAQKSNIAEIIQQIYAPCYRNYSIQGLCIVDGQPGEKITIKVDETDSRGRIKTAKHTFENSTDLAGMTAYVLNNHISEVYVGVHISEVDSQAYETLIENGKSIHFDLKKIVSFSTQDQIISSIGFNKTLSVGVYSFTGKQLVYLTLKRGADVVLGLLGLLALLPLIAVVKLCYLLAGDKKSIFYTHTRIGLNGKPFKMVKFRSMVHNADEILKEMLKDEKYRKEWEENQKFEVDPRITPIGNFLRKTSLDEVPQFINMLKGDMSLVGPRPLVPGELEMHRGLQLYNHVKPGITGWWGCNGRSNTTYEERLELEYYYVKNCSLYLDLLCIVKTVAAILKRDGAQ